MAQSLKTKLGVKDGDILLLINEPSEYAQKVELNDTNCVFHTEDAGPGFKANFIHIFTQNLESLAESFFNAADLADNKSMIWISWLKGTGKRNPEINRDQIRAFILQNSNWVDTKVCSFDDQWSGLKFLRRVK